MSSRSYSDQGPQSVRSAYSGGYSDTVRRQLERTLIPDKVKCNTCKKFRMQAAFSKRQLDILRNAMVVHGPRAAHVGHAKCRNCTGIQTCELRCCVCDQIKGLEEFAKNQRQDRDAARCLNCVQNHSEAEPVLEEHKLLTDNEPSTTRGTTITYSQRDTSSYIDSSRRLPPNGTPHYTQGSVSGEDDDDEVSIGGGVWIDEPEFEKDNSTSKGKGREYTAFDSAGNPHRLVASQSVATESIDCGWASWGVTGEVVRANAYMAPSPKRSNFAKVPKLERSTKSETPAMRAPEPAAPTVHSDDDDDTDVEGYI